MDLESFNWLECLLKVIMVRLKMKKKKKVLYAGIALVLSISMGLTGTFFIRNGPPKPRDIPLGDYSYTKDFTEFQVKKIMRKHHVPGVAISLLDAGEVVMEEYYGVADIETQSELTASNTLKIGSISKLFTAIEAMRLVEEGLVDLDTPITTYLPNFNISYRFDSTPITLRHLLTHRSGLPVNDNLVQWHWDAGGDTLKVQMESLNGTYAVFPAGYRFKYSNVGFNIIGHLIETMRGNFYAHYMAEHFFEPLGMPHSQFISTFLADASTIVPGYHREGRQNVLNDDRDIIEMASGGALCTIGDLQNFIRFLGAGGEFNGQRHINESTLLSMYTPQVSNPDDPQNYGLGFVVNEGQLGTKVVFHAGTFLGRKSILAFIPETNQGVIIFGNHENFEEPSKQLAFDILKVMYETKTGAAPPKKIAPGTVTLDSSALDQYTGEYMMEGEIVSVSRRRGNLKVKYKGIGLAMKPVGDRSFIITSILSPYEDVTVRFVPGSTFLGEQDMTMVVGIGGLHNIYCPRLNTFAAQAAESYPGFTAFPSLAGEYQVSPRIASNYTTSDDWGTSSIESVEGYLVMPTLRAALFPISDTEILLVGGVLEGETIHYEASTGVLTLQHMTFSPAG